MKCNTLPYEGTIWIFFAVICVSSTKNSTTTEINPSYSLHYDDSVYIEYNDTFDPNPECSVVPACQQSTSQWGDESLEGETVSFESTGCQTYVNCYEYATFPPEIPTQVTILTIQGSFFENLTRSNLEKLSDLVEVVIEFNELRHIEPGTFRKQARLEVLRLHGNKLTSLDAGVFRGLSSLKLLDLSNNGITKLFSHMFADMPNLLNLDLDLNAISSIGPGLFHHLSLLKSLSLKQNNITSLSKTAFQGLHRLKTLNLKQNHLDRIPALSSKHLPSLSSLYLSRNPISLVARNDFKELRSLRHLLLQDCRIRDVEKLAFHGMQLKTLVLEHNSLTNLPDLGNATKIKVLKLNGNPWNCDSRSVTMLGWLLRHNMKELTIPCYKPMEKRGNNLLDYSINELTSIERQMSNKTNHYSETNNSFQIQKISRIPLLRNEFPRYKLYEEFSSGSDRDSNVIESTSKTLFSPEFRFGLSTKQLNQDGDIIDDELSSKNGENLYSTKENIIKLLNSTQNRLEITTAASLAHQTATQSRKVYDDERIEKKQENAETKTIFTMTIITIVIVTTLILAVTLTVAAKNISKCYRNDKQYQTKPRKPLNKIKRRRSGKYDLTKARTQQVEVKVYGVFSKPETV